MPFQLVISNVCKESSEPVLQLPPAFAGLEKAAIIRQQKLERH